MCFCGIRKWNRFHAQVSCSVESSTGRLFNEERRTQSYAGAKGATSMLQQIVEPGEEVEEERGLWIRITLLPGFGILLAIGCVLIGQVNGKCDKSLHLHVSLMDFRAPMC